MIWRPPICKSQINLEVCWRVLNHFYHPQKTLLSKTSKFSLFCSWINWCNLQYLEILIMSWDIVLFVYITIFYLNSHDISMSLSFDSIDYINWDLTTELYKSAWVMYILAIGLKMGCKVYSMWFITQKKNVVCLCYVMSCQLLSLLISWSLLWLFCTLANIPFFCFASCNQIMKYRSHRIIHVGFCLISASSVPGNFRLTRGYSLSHQLLLQRYG